MPAHSVSINTPTNNRIRQIVQNLEETYTYTGQPEQFIYGGGKVNEYSQSGNAGSYPPTYMDKVEVGGNIKKTAKTQAKRVIEAVGNKAVKSLGGGPKKKMARASELKDAFDYGLKSVLNPVSKTLKPVAKLAKTVAPLAPLLLALGEGDMTTKPFKKRIRAVGGGAKARGAIVSKVMREHGLSLPMASAYVKQHGLY